MTLISTTDAAQEIGCDPATIRRICVRDSIGTRIGGSRILDRADVDRLRGIIKSSPGNPNFTPGNYFGKKNPKRKARKNATKQKM